MRRSVLYLLWTLFSLLPALAFAKPAHTLLPGTLQGQTFLFTVDGSSAPDNPNAGVSYLMHFTKHGYAYQVVGSDKIIKGHFHYHVHQDILGAVGVITATELFDGKLSSYQMVLVPRDKATGMYLYKQIKGAIPPDVRMNSAHYTRIIF